MTPPLPVLVVLWYTVYCMLISVLMNCGLFLLVSVRTSASGASVACSRHRMSGTAYVLPRMLMHATLTASPRSLPMSGAGLQSDGNGSPCCVGVGIRGAVTGGDAAIGWASVRVICSGCSVCAAGVGCGLGGRMYEVMGSWPGRIDEFFLDFAVFVCISLVAGGTRYEVMGRCPGRIEAFLFIIAVFIGAKLAAGAGCKNEVMGRCPGMFEAFLFSFVDVAVAIFLACFLSVEAAAMLRGSAGAVATEAACRMGPAAGAVGNFCDEGRARIAGPRMSR